METQVVNGAKKTGRVNAVTKILVDRLDEESVREWAKKEGLAVAEEDSVEQVATSLWARWQKLREGEKKVVLYTCDPKDGGCGGMMPNEEGACPFCAVDPEAAKAEPAGAKKEEEAPASTPRPKKAEDEEERPGKVIPDGTEWTEGSNPAPVEAATAPVEPRAGKSKKEKERKAKEAPRPAPPKMEPSTAIVPAASAAAVKDDTTPASMVQTVRDLDEAIGRYHKANEAEFVAWWHTSKVLLEIFAKKTWLLRVDKKGVPLFKKFEEFAEAELHLGPGHIWDRMKAAKAYTEQQAAKFGMTNYILMLKMPEEKRSEMEGKISRGEVKTNADTRSEVKKANKAKGKVKTKQSKTGERAVGGGRKKEFVRVAIADWLGKQTHAMKTLDGEKAAAVEVPAAHAKWLEKVLPFVERESLDGEVTEKLSLIVKDGKLKLESFRARAIDEEEEE